jgi:hypothetical protein
MDKLHDPIETLQPPYSTKLGYNEKQKYQQKSKIPAQNGGTPHNKI